MDPEAPVLLREGTRDDLPAVAHLLVLARAAAAPQMPPSVHGPQQQREWVRGWDLQANQLVVAEAAGELLGFALSTPTWLDQLFVDPRVLRRGVGTALLQWVMSTHPDGFGLWVFVTNTPAREFYARQGFTEVRRSDGSENEERAPDIHLQWSPGTAPATASAP